MNFFRTALFCAAMAPITTLLGEETVEGRVTRIVDGDSIVVTDAKDVKYEVQLEGIDAPELKQAFGKEATQGLSKLLKDQSVKITWESKDNFERLLAQVYLNDTHINQEMLKTGLAWHFKRYNKSEALAKLENEARDAKKGLWATEKPMAPWDFRKENKSPDKPIDK